MTHHPQIAHFDDQNQPPFACHDAHLTSMGSSSNAPNFEQSDF